MNDHLALIVDDNPADVTLIKEILSGIDNLRFDEACDVDKALDYLQLNTPDFIITDYSMPGHDGVYLIKEVRKKWPLLPVCMLSGGESPRSEALAAKANHFVLKTNGYENLELVRVVKSYLSVAS